MSPTLHDSMIPFLGSVRTCICYAPRTRLVWLQLQFGSSDGGASAASLQRNDDEWNAQPGQDVAYRRSVCGRSPPLLVVRCSCVCHVAFGASYQCKCARQRPMTSHDDCRSIWLSRRGGPRTRVPDRGSWAMRLDLHTDAM